MSDPAAKQRHLLDRTFDIAIILKGLDGLVEMIGGVLLLVVSPVALDNLVVRLTSGELSEDPHDFIARRMLHLSVDLHHTRTFGAAYLLSHGLVKIVLVAALLRERRWAYPAMLVFLVAFIAYQCYRLTYAPSIGLVLLALFDAFVVWLTWRVPTAQPTSHRTVVAAERTDGQVITRPGATHTADGRRPQRWRPSTSAVTTAASSEEADGPNAVTSTPRVPQW